METVRSALDRATQELSRVSVDSPRMTAELLLAHILETDRARVLTHDKDPIVAAQRDHYWALVGRRARGEPLQYITGVQEFYGRAFEVSSAVLIPRPETELLVEAAILRVQRSKSGREVRFVDLGTGSGCIAVSFSAEVRQAVGVAVDISADALVVARRNAARHGVDDRIKFLEGDFLAAIAEEPAFDFILANPPYVPRTYSSLLSALVRDNEPQVALYGGETGLDAYEQIIPQAFERLLSGGYLLLEMGAGQDAAVRALMEDSGFKVDEMVNDLQGIPRCLVGVRHDTGTLA